MLIKQIMEVFDVLDSSTVDGAAVKKYLQSVNPEANVEVYPLEGPKGSTDMVKVRIPGTNGKSKGGSAPTIGLLGRLGGIGARPEMIGFVSDGDNTITVVLDTKLTPELIEEGFVREIISKVQTMRKEADFQVTDKIVISCKGNEKIEELIRANADQIKSEVLAVDVKFDEANGYVKDWSINGENVTMGVERA